MYPTDGFGAKSEAMLEGATVAGGSSIAVEIGSASGTKTEIEVLLTGSGLGPTKCPKCWSQEMLFLPTDGATSIFCHCIGGSGEMSVVLVLKEIEVGSNPGCWNGRHVQYH